MPTSSIQNEISSKFPKLTNFKFLNEQGYFADQYHQGLEFRVKCPLTPGTHFHNLFLGGNYLTDCSLEGAVKAGHLASDFCSKAKYVEPSDYHRTFASIDTGA